MEDKEIIRHKIREIVMDLNDENLKEYDLITKSKSDWNEEKREMRKTFTNILKHIEDDKYKQGVVDIDKAIKSLELWKRKIEKLI